MKKLAIFAACAAAHIAVLALDDYTVSRMEAKINERNIVSRDMIVIDGVTNTVTRYRQAGNEWTETNVAIFVTGVIAPKRYSTLKLLSAIADTGRYLEVKAALQSAATPNGMPYWDALLAAQYLLADDPRLEAGISLAVQSGLCTSNDVATILSKAED